MNPVELDASIARSMREGNYKPLGLGPLLRAAALGSDLTAVGERLVDYSKTKNDPRAMLDLALVLELKYQKAAALAVQDLALQMRRHYRVQDAKSSPPPVRLLALKAPGDLMANTPFECLLGNADVQIEVLYVDRKLPQFVALPDHDVVLVAACASDANAESLVRAAELVAATARPVLNRPERIALTTRDAAYSLLGHVPNIAMARTLRVGRTRLLSAAAGEWDLSREIGEPFPYIIRPVGSHAGQGLARIFNGDELRDYVEKADVEEFYVAPFIDYSGADGLYRKYRIVLIDGQPYACHMGISQHWIVHYPYPEMIAHPERRDEEARFMATFGTDFAVRHRDALNRIATLSGLDYIGFDCAETPDGRLLIFEVATAMVVHDTDDTSHFPYKQPQMRRVFSAFSDMLQRTAARPVEGNTMSDDR